MNYLTCSLLNDEETKIMAKDLCISNNNWEDGKKTAGTLAANVKNNLQMDRKLELSKNYSKLIQKRILSNPLVKSFALPKKNSWNDVY